MKVDFRRIRGVIFDMDGVLVDSEPAMARSAVEGMAEYGITASPEDFTPYLGTDEKTYFGCVAELHGGTYSDALGRRIYDIYCETAPSRVVPFAGAAEAVIRIHKMGYRTAIASSATKRKLEVNITASRIPREALGCIVSGSDVVKRKPDPEIFLTAAARLGLSPEACIVAEDALSGVESGKSRRNDLFWHYDDVFRRDSSGSGSGLHRSRRCRFDSLSRSSKERRLTIYADSRRNGHYGNRKDPAFCRKARTAFPYKNIYRRGNFLLRRPRAEKI